VAGAVTDSNAVFLWLPGPMGYQARRGIMKVLPFIACALYFASPILTQEGKVVLVNSESKDLKRTAYRLRIPVERLKNARQALQDATDLIKRVQPVPAAYVGQISNSWVMLNRPKAKASIKDIFSALRTMAVEAREPKAYTDATAAASQVLTMLAQLDPDEALRLTKGWPEPAKTLGESAMRAKSGLESQFRQSAASLIATRNPDAALKLWPVQGEGSPTAEFGSRAAMAEAMMRSGRRDEAVKIVDRMISELGSAEFPQINPDDLSYVAQAIARVSPDRFPDAFRVIVQSASAYPSGGAPSVTVEDHVILLDISEAVALNLLKDIQQRPALVIRMLDEIPGLRSKLEPIGGIDGVLAAGGPVQIAFGNQGSFETTTYYPSDAITGDQRLFAQLTGKDAESAREKLAGIDASPAQVYDLCNAAFGLAAENPDLSSSILDRAKKLIDRIDPVTARVPLYQQLLRTTRRCEGEISSELFKQGFALVARLRDENTTRAKPEGTPRRGGSPGDMLERALLSELAIDDFEAAEKYVKTMPEGQERVSGFLALLESCRRPF
jgi:hypothetical protein